MPVNRNNNIDDFIGKMNALSDAYPNDSVSENWHLHTKNGLLRFAYSRKLPGMVQMKCIEIFVNTLSNRTCVIGSYS
jgi:hypothetical protein